MGVKLTDRTAEVKAALRERIAVGLNNAAGTWVDFAQGAANVDTGFMKEHIFVSVGATASSLFAIVRSLAPYSQMQDTGARGNLYWTRAYLAVRDKFKQFIYGGTAIAGQAGPGVIRAALEEFHGPMGRKGGGF